MIERVLLLVSALVACGDEPQSCPSIQDAQSFSVIVDDEAWRPQNYQLRVSYVHRDVARAYRCDVRVPLFAPDGGLGSEAAGAPCQALEGPVGMDDSELNLELGRAIVATFPGTPATARLQIDTPQGRLLEQDVQLEYEVEYPYGRACGGPKTAAVRIELP